MITGNLFESLLVNEGGEQVESMLDASGFRLQRIVSRAHATPPGEWYDQDYPEWVVLLKGAAGLSIEGESEVRLLRPGDYLLLPARLKHRVEWTQPGVETIWLALHYGW